MNLSSKFTFEWKKLLKKISLHIVFMEKRIDLWLIHVYAFKKNKVNKNKRKNKKMKKNLFKVDI